MCAVNHSGFHGTEFQKTVAHLKAELNTYILQSATFAQGAAEALHDKDIAGYLAGSILFPQVKVGFPVRDVEVLELVKMAVQGEVFIEFAQCYVGIAVRVVQGVVEIQKYVFVVLFHWGWFKGL